MQYNQQNRWKTLLYIDEQLKLLRFKTDQRVLGAPHKTMGYRVKIDNEWYKCFNIGFVMQYGYLPPTLSLVPNDGRHANISTRNFPSVPYITIPIIRPAIHRASANNWELVYFRHGALQIEKGYPNVYEAYLAHCVQDRKQYGELFWNGFNTNDGPIDEEKFVNRFGNETSIYFEGMLSNAELSR